MTSARGRAKVPAPSSARGPVPRPSETAYAPAVARAAVAAPSNIRMPESGPAEGKRSPLGEPGRSKPSSSGGGGEPMLRKSIRVFGEVFITLGVVVLLFALYQVFGTYYETKGEQNKLEATIDQQWEEQRESGELAAPEPEELEIGDGIAKLYIPRMNNRWVVVEGEQPADIKYAPGHYRQSAMPGQSGNFAIAGHRSPAIFMNLDVVKQGDYILVETVTNWYVYKVYQTQIVAPSDVWVVQPDSNNPDRKLLTLTTCHPKYDNYQRLIVHAELARQEPAGGEKPQELTA